jgi:hypothetical protein
MSEELEILLRNAGNETQSVYFSISSSTIAQKWKNHLIRTLQSPHHLEKSYCFLGFLGSTRSIPYLGQELNRVAERISNFVGEGPWKYGYKISERFADGDDIFPVLHALHHHFEKLIGQAWAVSPYYSCAPHEIRILIHHLNYLVHEIEALKFSELEKQKSGVFYPYSVVAFPDSPARPELFSDEDYESFSLNRPFGALTLHYAQTGKAFYDAWRDNDQKIGKNNINSLRYVSGQFDINWGDGPEFSEAKIRRHFASFFQWLQNLGYSTENIHYFMDEKGQQQGLGFVEVARLREDQRSLGIEYWQSQVAEFNDIYALRVHSGGEVVERIYEYRLADRLNY